VLCSLQPDCVDAQGVLAKEMPRVVCCHVVGECRNHMYAARLHGGVCVRACLSTVLLASSNVVM
jgi:hypothetical protein